MKALCQEDITLLILLLVWLHERNDRLSLPNSLYLWHMGCLFFAAERSDSSGLAAALSVIDCVYDSSIIPYLHGHFSASGPLHNYLPGLLIKTQNINTSNQVN